MVTLRTYGKDGFETEFTVSEKWLQKQLDMPLEEFLDTYTYDDSELILQSANKQQAIIDSKNV